jgi:2-haloacid dehalogenase
MTKPELVTFDVYAALLDIEGTLVSVVADALNIAGTEATPIVRLWRAKQLERAGTSNSLSGSRTSFRDCTTMALDYVARRQKLEISQAVRQNLCAAWNQLKPWPDAVQTIADLKARGIKTAVLSNGDQDMLEAVVAHIEAPFDHVLSSETCGAYKPHPDVYALPKTVLGVSTEATIHVAGSANDVLGAKAFGMTCIWSNRLGDVLVDPAYPPDHEVSCLAEVAALL